MKKQKITMLILLLSFCFFAKAQTGINTNTPNPNALLDITSPGKGILIPRIDYAARPASPVSGMMIYVTANGPSGNDAFYYYDGTAWLKTTSQTDVQSLALAGTSLTISNANTVSLGDIAPVQGDIKCSGVYINPFTDINNCGSCGHVCPGIQTCVSGTCQ